MNCKQGDLAIVVGTSAYTDLGSVVTCMRLADESDFGWAKPHPSLGPVWYVGRNFKWTQGDAPCMPDSMLMPINPLNDETVDETDTVKAS